jgi:hypothetical protein
MSSTMKRAGGWSEGQSTSQTVSRVILSNSGLGTPHVAGIFSVHPDSCSCEFLPVGPHLLQDGLQPKRCRTHKAGPSQPTQDEDGVDGLNKDGDLRKSWNLAFRKPPTTKFFMGHTVKTKVASTRVFYSSAAGTMACLIANGLDLNVFT